MISSQRYRVDQFYAKHLEGNAIEDNPLKKCHIYLPPKYFTQDNQETYYPVIYLLHGYSGDINDLLIISKEEIPKHYPFIYRVILRKFFKNFPTLEQLDNLINTNQLKSFILVQADGSLPIENIFKEKGFNGLISKKGSFYLNSPYTGNYADYIFEDLVNYIDHTYRTIPKKSGRALIGGSMGGFGALLGGILKPDLFSAIAALSPAISWLELFNHQEIIPFYQRIYGKRKAIKLGQQDLDDILDTADLIFSKDVPLLPSIKRDENGNIISFNSKAKEKWMERDLNSLIHKYPNAFHNCALQITCEENDEYGFLAQIQQFNTTLHEKGISADLQIFHDSYASKISPHMIGIVQKLIPGLMFCSKYLSDPIDQ
ncbi:MAG: esterase family protein [Candidatus Lokiarchaeota archaeon]|nr:esterase family protein [Candidatus Harpocratesius repetitus]